MATYAFDNAAQNFTSTTVASNATTVQLNSTSLFSPSNQYIVRADDSASTAFMYALVTGNNTATNVLTWTEGVDGTSAIALGASSTVTEVITKKTINDTLVRLDTAVSQTLTGPLVIPTLAGGSTISTSYGSMPVKIFESLLASTAASISITPLPTGYRHLFLEWYARGDTAAVSASITLRFNNISTTTYDYDYLQIAGASTAGMTVVESIGATGVIVGFMPAANATASYFGQGEIRVKHYQSTVGNKVVTADNTWAVADTSANQVQNRLMGKWRTTATAITRLDLLPSAGNFLTGSLFTLYGIP